MVETFHSSIYEAAKSDFVVIFDVLKKGGLQNDIRLKMSFLKLWLSRKWTRFKKEAEIAVGMKSS